MDSQAAELSMRTLCLPCAAFVPVVTIGKVVLWISVFYERPCALSISSGAVAVQKKNIYIYIYIYEYEYECTGYIYIYIYIYI